VERPGPRPGKRFVFVLCDGLGDRPLEPLGGKTPLEAAETPNLDEIARLGVSGIMDPIKPGVRPGTDVGTLANLGYDPYAYYRGRGPIEAAGVGIKLRPGDVALRGNFATIDDRWIVIDRRAGRIREGTRELAEALSERVKIPGVEVLFKEATEHRLVVVIRGEGLSDKISDSDPGATHEGEPVRRVEPLDDTPEAARTAEIVNEMLRQAHEILKDHPVNVGRVKRGLLPANAIITRGAGMVPDIPPIGSLYGVRGFCVAGESTIVGIARMVGMDATIPPGATGNIDTDTIKKAEVALEALKKGYDFVLISVKGPDIAGHDGNIEGKMEIIRKIDAMVGRLLDEVSPDDTYIALSADHSTPCSVGDHTADPVPVAIAGPGVRVDDVTRYGERDAAKGGLGRIRGVDLVPIVMDLMFRTKKYGA